MVQSTRSLPDPELAFLPPIVIMLGLLTLLVVAGHSLMKPAVYSNPGLAAYKPPTLAVRDYARSDQSVDLERAARQVAEAENAKLEIRSPVVAQTRSMDGLDRLAATVPQQTTAHAERRDDASRTRVAQAEPVNFAQRWVGGF